MSAVWIPTFTGRAFRPLDPRFEDINIVDIGHSLSMINRFLGHTPWPYSVAQHSVLMTKYAREMGNGKLVQRACLLHDASEAFICDLVSPVKKEMPTYVLHETRLDNMIQSKFFSGVPVTEVKKAFSISRKYDLRILKTEAELFFPNPPEPWNLEDIVSLPVTIEPWDWARAKSEFLTLANELIYFKR